MRPYGYDVCAEQVLSRQIRKGIICAKREDRGLGQGQYKGISNQEKLLGAKGIDIRTVNRHRWVRREA